MSEGVYITKTDFNQMMKKLTYLEQYVKNSLQEKSKSRWMNPAEAMKEIGCGKTKLNELRFSGQVEWKASEKGRGVMILRKSVEDYNFKNSTLLKAI